MSIQQKLSQLATTTGKLFHQWTRIATPISFHWSHAPTRFHGTAVVFFPSASATLNCGLAGLIAVHGQRAKGPNGDLAVLDQIIAKVQANPLNQCASASDAITKDFLGGDTLLDELSQAVLRLKQQNAFLSLFKQHDQLDHLDQLTNRLSATITQESEALAQEMGRLTTQSVETADQRITRLKDVAWCLKAELADNISRVKKMLGSLTPSPPEAMVIIFRNINSVLNSLDRLEVRGRDSAGISLLFILDSQIFAELIQALRQAGLQEAMDQRINQTILGDGSISIAPHDDTQTVGLTITYKVAAEIGSLGDNVNHLRHSITNDPILHQVARVPHRFHTISAHTRWASVGAITVANCHPVDNRVATPPSKPKGIIHACLNGDIDNYLDLKQAWESKGVSIPDDITTDTKIIPLQIETYVNQGHPVAEAFRLAVNDFKGSHAIAMHTDLAPGKFFLAQKGSGQAVFIGLADDHYIPASEVYGFVEETSRFLKLDGEKVVEGPNGPTQGQLFILDQASAGDLEGISACYYDGTPLKLSERDIQRTEITSRDIDRQNYPHYFLKEISEAPLSVARTLQNRWKIIDEATGRYTIALDEASFPEKITQALMDNRIRRIYFIGQGTAGVAALASADILNYYLNEPSLKIRALKASEMSGFELDAHGEEKSMQDTIVIAISQSGTTTDTNRTVDMVRGRGAYTMAIVNRRDSDITFKVDGVIYTSSGRDIEMSVASTKAFYSQIVASALISLKIAEIKKRRSAAFVTAEIKALQRLPGQMRTVLAMGDDIRASAERLAPTRTYWAAVGSGPNKAAADEIRIKLSELCYKTISSDYVEDKKHIDLSSEPLIIVCAAGTPATVIGDIIKDTAIFKAHKAAPIVIVDDGDDRFDPYAEDVLPVPAVSPHLAPIMNTLAGHLWGYYAALSINNGSRFLHHFRQEMQITVDQFAQDGLDVYEVVLEKRFREKVAQFYTRFRQRQSAGSLPTTISHTTDLILLLKYLAGRLPVSDFELDFGKKGTALNMLNCLFEFLGESINGMSRPVDAIKHQAKTVTVGTSRISERTEGLLFEALEEHGILTAQLINRNIIVLKNLQAIVGRINGSILYRIEGLDVLGELTEDTTINVMRKTGVLEPLSSRVETDNSLKGTKRIIVREGNVYIGKGRKDDRSIIIVPAISTDRDTPNRIESLLLLNIDFKDQVPLPAKIKALGGKFERIKNIVQENSVVWDNAHLEMVPIENLFGHSAEKIGEFIVSNLSQLQPA